MAVVNLVKADCLFTVSCSGDNHSANSGYIESNNYKRAEGNVGDVVLINRTYTWDTVSVKIPSWKTTNTTKTIKFNFYALPEADCTSSTPTYTTDSTKRTYVVTRSYPKATWTNFSKYHGGNWTIKAKAPYIVKTFSDKKTVKYTNTPAYGAYSIILPDAITGSNIPSKYAGYVFDKWKVDSGSTYYKNNTYSAGGKFSVSADVSTSQTEYKLYATYTPIKTTVILTQNIYTRSGNTVTKLVAADQRGAPATIMATYDSKLPALTTGPSDSRYNFLYFLACKGINNPNTDMINWTDKYYPKDGSTEATWKQYDTSITYYLIGVWEPKKFNLVANSNGGNGWLSIPTGWTTSGTTSCTKSVSYNTKYGNLPVPTAEGKIFDGWWTATTGGTKVTKDIVFTTAGTITIFAHWINGTIVKLNPDGGIWPDTGGGAIKEITLMYNGVNDGKNIINPIPTKNGYILTGFYAPDDTCVYAWDSYVSAKWMPSQSGTITYWAADGKWKYYSSTTLTLTAQWEKATDYTFLEDGPHGIKSHWAYTSNGWKRITKIFSYNNIWKPIK